MKSLREGEHRVSEKVAALRFLDLVRPSTAVGLIDQEEACLPCLRGVILLAIAETFVYRKCRTEPKTGSFSGTVVVLKVERCD